MDRSMWGWEVLGLSGQELHLVCAPPPPPARLNIRKDQGDQGFGMRRAFEVNYALQITSMV